MEYHYHPRGLTRIELAQQTKAPFGIGSYTKGNILIIGEKASDPNECENQQPFSGMKGSSKWLNDLLDDACIPEDKLFWVNAINNDGTLIDIKSLTGYLESPCVIALGKVAANLCKNNDIQHIQFNHPSYHKRFNNHYEYPLISYLKERAC